MKVFLRNKQGSNTTGAARRIGLNMCVYTHLYTYVYICICKCFYIKDREQHWMRGSSKCCKYLCARTFMYVTYTYAYESVCVCICIQSREQFVCVGLVKMV